MDSFIKLIESVIARLSLGKALGIALLFIVLIAICRLLVSIISRVLSRTKLGENFATFITAIIKYVLYFVSVLIVCDALGLPITSLLAVFSLFGLAISLSVQSLLGNIMSGVSLHTLKPFEVGDYIETDISGTVKGIGLFYTELLTPDNKKVYIPNEKIMANKLVNYSSEAARRIDLVFNAEYGFDTALVMRALREAAESVDAVKSDPEPIIGIAEYGESGISYSVWAWCDTADYINTSFAIREAVWQVYAKYGIKMAYNRLQVEMVNNEEKSID